MKRNTSGSLRHHCPTPATSRDGSQREAMKPCAPPVPPCLGQNCPIAVRLPHQSADFGELSRAVSSQRSAISKRTAPVRDSLADCRQLTADCGWWGGSVRCRLWGGG